MLKKFFRLKEKDTRQKRGSPGKKKVSGNSKYVENKKTTILIIA